MGLESIFNWLLERLKDVLPLFVVLQYQEAVLLRGGKFKKVLAPGVYFKIPIYDEIIYQIVVTTTLSLPAQSLTTKDSKDIVVKGMVKYKILDTKIFILEVFDAIDAISDITQAVIKNIVMESSWQECLGTEVDNEITKKARSEIKKYGVHIEQVTLTDITKTRSIRLFNEGPSII